MGMIVIRQPLPVKRTALLIFLLTGALAMTTGCSPWKTIKKTGKSISRIRISGDDMGKKIGFLPFENRTAFKGQPFAETFQNRLQAFLGQECSDLRQAGNVDSLAKLPRLDNGLVDNLALAAAGRRLGLNAVATGAVIDVTGIDRTEGWFWFKAPHRYLQVHLAVDVYDTQTGAKLLYESISGESEIEEYDFEETSPGQAENLALANAVIEELAGQAAEKICDALAAMPWVGFVVEADESGIRLSSGSHAGLYQGQVLDVFTTERVYTGAAGQEYLVPGPKIGELRVSAVRPEQADAVRISGKPPVAGDAVKVAD